MDAPYFKEAVFVYLNQDELIQWDAHDEKARETFRDSQRESDRSSAEDDHNPVVILTDGHDRIVLSVGKFDRAGILQFIDLEGIERQIPCDAPHI